ncbi:MAG: GNAT family N-acetyltransferase [Bacteroidales bacterium]|nr:GNAT family N-acetyltransferase [Bacteroidales bacterium]
MTSTVDSVSLRALEPEDLELIYHLENDSTFWRFGASTVPYSRYALRQYLSSAQNDIFTDKQVRLVIEQDGEALGLADLYNFDAMHLRAEIGLIVLPEHQGRHVGRKAMELLCKYAIQLHLHQLYAIIAATNKPATRLFRSLDFEASSVLHDWLRDEEQFVDATVWQKIL